MNDYTPPGHAGDPNSALDTLLRDAIPEIKLALGELIDRENARALPEKYARILPESLLVVTLREDAAEALAPVAVAVERELTDSCTRHGSLYDRAYRVQLRRTTDPEAPLYSVASHAGHGAGEDGGAEDSAPHADLPAVRADHGGHAEPPPAPAPSPAAPPAAAAAALPLADPDATRLDRAGPAGWQPGRWLLVVEDEGGEQREVFRITDAYSTVGRRSEDPQLRTTFALSEAPHVSRRQLALLWEERDGAPGFRVFNLGLNPVHLPGRDVSGARLGRGVIDLDSVSEEHTGWMPPGVPLRIGEQGPVLRIEEVPEEEPEELDESEDSEEEEWEAEPDDPDATRYG